MKTRWMIPAAMIAAMCASASAMAVEPQFEQSGDKFEYGHFTAEAIAYNGNAEEFNENADVTIYSIMDYTEAVPMADSYPTNGVTEDNNTSSTYVILSDTKALVIDLGNGAGPTAAHFGEDSEDQEVLDSIDAEFRELIQALTGDREVSVAITHNHGDHLGYCSALANEGYKLYFPEGDYTERVVESFGDLSQVYDLETFNAGDLTIDLDTLEIETIDCKGHTDASTLYLLDIPVVTYEYDEAGEAVDSSATYYLFTGDAIGSGSSGWIFSVNNLNMLSSSIGSVLEKVSGYTDYNDYLGEAEKTDASLRIEGGHGWQVQNRFGEMAMDIRYIENMKALTEKIPEGNWVEEGTDGKTLEELLQEGNLVTKATGAWLDTTIYYGQDLDAVAGITTSTDTLKEAAGIPVEEET